jgi:hypothetical protein
MPFRINLRLPANADARLEAARLQAAGSKVAGSSCTLQGCRLQGSRLQVEGCKGLVTMLQAARCKAAGSRLLAAGCKAAGCRLQGAKRECANTRSGSCKAACRLRDPRLQAAICYLQGCRQQLYRLQAAGLQAARGQVWARTVHTATVLAKTRKEVLLHFDLHWRLKTATLPTCQHWQRAKPTIQSTVKRSTKGPRALNITRSASPRGSGLVFARPTEPREIPRSSYKKKNKFARLFGSQ